MATKLYIEFHICACRMNGSCDQQGLIGKNQGCTQATVTLSLTERMAQDLKEHEIIGMSLNMACDSHMHNVLDKMGSGAVSSTAT